MKQERLSDKENELLQAVVSGDCQLVTNLLEREKVNIHCCNRSNSLLHIAVNNQNRELVEILLKHQARIDTRDVDNLWSPLHLAVIKGDEPIVKLLLKHADNQRVLDIQDIKGNTPLHHAVLSGNTKLVNLLLEQIKLENLMDLTKILTNPQPSLMLYVKNNDGKTPLDLAQAAGQSNLEQATENAKIIKLLQSYDTAARRAYSAGVGLADSFKKLFDQRQATNTSVREDEKRGRGI